MSRKTMKELLNAHEILVSSGVYDFVSACLADLKGFTLLPTTAAGLGNARLGLPTVSRVAKRLTAPTWSWKCRKSRMLSAMRYSSRLSAAFCGLPVDLARKG